MLRDVQVGVGSPAVTPYHSRTRVFDRLFAAAVPALLGGTYRQDQPPVDGGRWPVSIVCVPNPCVRRVLADWMQQAVQYTGPGHFGTGSISASHFTVRALEPYRAAASPDEGVAREWAAAPDAAAHEIGPVRLRLTGVTLSTSAVMAQAEPVDDLAWELMRCVKATLGSHAWYENRGHQRDIWYASVLHFAAPLLDAPGLVEWAGERREVKPVDVLLDSISLVRFRYRQRSSTRVMAMEPWHTAALGGSGAAR